ncbi:citrate transporter [Cupriavidus basilensis]|nr:citrate transporter [Cupriavidus basilensis]
MLTLLGFGMILTFMVLIMTKRLSPLIALIIVPIAFAVAAGFAPKLGPMMLSGIKSIAPTGVLLMFAILYFGIMIDAGLFDPLIRVLLKVMKGDPLRVVMGTAVLALIVSLDGDGSTTYMITVSALLPLYLRLGMRPLVMVCVIFIANGVMNITPWGGPTSRVAAALHLDAGAIFVPMLPIIVAGACTVLAVAWLLGRGERRRLGKLALVPQHLRTEVAPGLDQDGQLPSIQPAEDTKRPRLIWINATLTTVLMATLVADIVPIPVLFMVAAALALLINYPHRSDQRQRIAAHAENILAVVSIIFAAGIFTGILSGTGMIQAMSHAVLAMLPPSFGPYLAPITAFLSLPFTFFLSNDAFYYGVVPIIAQVAGNYGITPLEIARASLIGQPVHLLSPLVPSTYLLVGLASVDFGDHQRFAFKWTLLVCALMFSAGLSFAIFPFAR